MHRVLHNSEINRISHAVFQKLKKKCTMNCGVLWSCNSCSKGLLASYMVHLCSPGTRYTPCRENWTWVPHTWRWEVIQKSDHWWSPSGGECALVKRDSTGFVLLFSLFFEGVRWGETKDNSHLNYIIINRWTRDLSSKKKYSLLALHAFWSGIEDWNHV